MFSSLADVLLCTWKLYTWIEQSYKLWHASNVLWCLVFFFKSAIYILSIWKWFSNVTWCIQGDQKIGETQTLAKTAQAFQLVIMPVTNFFSKYNCYTKSTSITAQLKFTHTKMLCCVKSVSSPLSLFSKAYVCCRINYGSGVSNSSLKTFCGFRKWFPVSCPWNYVLLHRIICLISDAYTVTLNLLVYQSNWKFAICLIICKFGVKAHMFICKFTCLIMAWVKTWFCLYFKLVYWCKKPTLRYMLTSFGRQFWSEKVNVKLLICWRHGALNFTHNTKQFAYIFVLLVVLCASLSRFLIKFDFGYYRFLSFLIRFVERSFPFYHWFIHMYPHNDMTKSTVNSKGKKVVFVHFTKMKSIVYVHTGEKILQR